MRPFCFLLFLGATMFLLVFSGCATWPWPPQPVPPPRPAATPIRLNLAEPGTQEAELPGNLADIDTSWLVGSILDKRECKVLMFNNYLAPTAHPKVTLLGEIVCEGFVDQSAAAKAEWLSSVKAQVEEGSYAEVSATKVSTSTISPKDIDRGKLVGLAKGLPPDQPGPLCRDRGL